MVASAVDGTAGTGAGEFLRRSGSVEMGVSIDPRRTETRGADDS